METLIAMAVIVITGTVVLAAWFINYRIQTNRLLAEHQKVWDELKNRLEAQGLREIDIDDYYMEYMAKLMASSGTYGACFPRR